MKKLTAYRKIGTVETGFKMRNHEARSNQGFCNPLMYDANEISPRSDRDVSWMEDESARRASEELLSPLPNDLTRLIYLTSLRDYNSGTYRHPVLSRRFNAITAHRAFEIWHQHVFARLLSNPISKYVEDLEGYLRYSHAEPTLFIKSWRALQAYKAAVPLHVAQRARETFFLNVETALKILERGREEKGQTGSAAEPGS